MATIPSTFVYPIGSYTDCVLTDGAIRRGYAYFPKIEVEQMFPWECLGERDGNGGKPRRRGSEVTIELPGEKELHTDMARQGLKYRPGTSLASCYKNAAEGDIVRLTCIGTARYRVELHRR
jgi:hypothetical protein